MRVNIPLKMQASDEQRCHKYKQCRGDAPHFAQFVVAPNIALAFCLIKLADRFHHTSNRLACLCCKVTRRAAIRVPDLSTNHLTYLCSRDHRSRRRV